MWAALAIFPMAGAACGYAPAVPVRVSEHVWMMPGTEREDGCPQFRKYSPRYAVDMAMYYRTPDGGFTSDLNASECR